MIYQIIDGDRIPVTYVLDQTSRTVVLFLVGQTGSNIQIQVALTDLSENMIFSDEPIIIYTYDRCMFVPEIVINSGAARTQNRNLHVQVNVLPDGTIAPEAPPILYAFLSTDKTVLEQFRNQHVINDDPAQYGTRPVPHPNLPGRWLNSNQWYLDFDDIGLVSPSHLGPEPVDVGGPPIAWAEFTRQPQDINDYWMRAHIEDTDLPTILRIDKSRDGFVSINWMMSVLEYAQHTGNSFEVWGFIVDLLGNASIIVKDDILIDPPYSRYYPREDDYARRRNHRWRGPKESEKILVSSDEFGYTTSAVVGEMSFRAQDNIISVSAGLGGRIDKVLMNINHIRVQRGQT